MYLGKFLILKNRLASLILLFFSLPIWPVLYLAVRLESRGPFIFKQTRAGINRKPFTIYKIRTMVENAEKLKKKYLKLNEAHGPVFKIRDDPRHTSIGRLISRMALDELPQLINVLRGEMALVGPRPLPIREAEKVQKKYEARFSVLPGMTSTWVIKGGHKLSFDEWMKLDLEYIKRRSFLRDIEILGKTLILVLRVIFINSSMLKY